MNRVRFRCHNLWLLEKSFRSGERSMAANWDLLPAGQDKPDVAHHDFIVIGWK